MDPKDHVLILDEGVSVEYGVFKNLATSADSRVLKFFKQKDNEDEERKEKKKRVISQFQKRVHRTISINRVLERLASNDTTDDTDTVKESVRSTARAEKISALQKRF